MVVSQHCATHSGPNEKEVILASIRGIWPRRSHQLKKHIGWNICSTSESHDHRNLISDAPYASQPRFGTGFATNESTTVMFNISRNSLTVNTVIMERLGMGKRIISICFQERRKRITILRSGNMYLSAGRWQVNMQNGCWPRQMAGRGRKWDE